MVREIRLKDSKFMEEIPKKMELSCININV